MKKEKCYCSFCKNERVYIKKKHIHFFDVLFCAFAATLLSFIFWQKLDPRLMLLFVLFCIFGEAMVRIRWRLAMICTYCGFDPILYLRDPDKMSRRVSEYMEKRSKAPSYVLSNKLYDKIARKKVPKNQQQEQKSAET